MSLKGMQVKQIPTDKLEINKLNPRRIVDEESDDRLLQSIYEKGIIVPLVVYLDTSKDRFFIIDGERRFKCAQKINLLTVPAHLLDKKPTELENILLMFHIHMVRKDWSDVATALAIREIKDHLGTDKIAEIAKYTGLKPYRVSKYLRILNYSNKILRKFLESEAKGEDDKLDTDILVELSRPLNILENRYPDILQKFNKEKIVEIIIKKKEKGKIIKNKEIRDLSKNISI